MIYKRCYIQGGLDIVLQDELDRVLQVGLYRILIWPDIRRSDIRPIIFPDTGYPEVVYTHF